MTKEEFNRIPIGGNMEVTLKDGKTYDLTGVDWTRSEVEIETGYKFISNEWIPIEKIESIEVKG